MAPELATIITAIISGGLVLLGFHITNLHRRNELLTNERKAFIAEVRLHISAKDFKPYEFPYTVTYLRLRPYLPDDLRKKLEPEPNTLKGESYIGSPINPFVIKINDVLTALEKYWGIFY